MLAPAGTTIARVAIAPTVATVTDVPSAASLRCRHAAMPRSEAALRALLKVTHHGGSDESYDLECRHGSTNGGAHVTSLETREKYVVGLLARHGVPYGCSCAAETDLADVYPSADSAIEQITAGGNCGMAELDDEATADLAGKIDDARCPECSVAILLMPLHVPLAAEAIHEPRCPRAKLQRS